MTLSKLAQLANVLVSVVSKAFSGRNDISDTMREHVFSVARANGCFHQFYHARYDKPVIAVIVPEVISKYYIRYIEFLKKSIEESGYTMLLSISNFDKQLTEELIRYYTEYGKVDGMIIVDGNASYSKDIKTTIVAITAISNTEIEVRIEHSMRSALREVIELLYSMGHRRIAYIGEALTDGKRRILVEEVSRLGIDILPEYFYSSRMRFEDAGRDGVEAIFSNDREAPTAVFGAYGYITQGIISALTERGYSIPEDVSVISMDSDPAPLDPCLDVAYIDSDNERACAEAIRMLKSRIGVQNPNSPAVVKHIATLHLGETVSHAKTK